MAQRIDVDAARPIGEPFSIAERVEYFFTTSRAMFSVSGAGTVAYHAGGELGQLLWADQRGNEIGTVGSQADYEPQSTRLSRDGKTLLTSRRQPGLGTYDVWRLDLVRGTEERLTADRGSEVTPVWVDGQQAIVFAADRGGSVPHMFRRNLTTGVEEPLVPAGRQQLVMDVFPGEPTVAYLERSATGSFDIFRVPLTGRRSPAPLLTSRLSKFEMRMSPDGRAMAFLASDGARVDLYVAPVPMTSAPVLTASGAATGPRWSGDGRRLYYLSAGRRMMAVDVHTAPSIAVGAPRQLFELKRPASLKDVSRDGRFLLYVPVVRAAERPIVVANATVSRPAS